MNSTNDLIVTVSSNYTWSLLREYAVSLHMSEFKGTKLMCARGLHPEAVKNLSNLGFKLEDFPIGKGTFFISRYGPAIDYIRKNLRNLRYVIWTDCRDVVVQKDPSLWLENNFSGKGIVGSRLGMKIKEDNLENHWVSICTSPDDPKGLEEEPAICVGTVAGDAHSMLDILTLVYQRGISLSAARPDFTAGMDEGLFNCLFRSSAFTTHLTEIKDTFSAQCAYLLVPTFERPWEISSEGVVYPKNSKDPYCIVHQYDRDTRWKSLIQSRYTDANLPAYPMADRHLKIHSLRWKGRQ